MGTDVMDDVDDVDAMDANIRTLSVALGWLRRIDLKALPTEPENPGTRCCSNGIDSMQALSDPLFTRISPASP